jgi:radical SAM superfamily enzyme YgiQ (UPF0313 family)
MGKKNIYLWNKGIVSGRLLPVLWFSAKTYFEEFGKTVNEWNWCDPFIQECTKEEVLSHCEKNPPSVFGFSVYIWSHIEVDELAKEIKKLYPKCLIVYGGPQNNVKYTTNFFTLRPWVDLVVPSDVYGEAIVTNILDNYNNLNYADIPEVYYHRGGVQFKSKHEFIKRSFVWPKNIFINQQKYFNFDTTNSLIVYETARGCPYKCIYCDWGGGTYTKVVKKPLETVFSEIEFLCANKIESFYIADANFGIFKQDLEITKHLVAMKKKYGYPLSVTVENAKNHLDRVMQIQRLLIENQLVFYYKLSVQNPNDEIKKNIERIDIPFAEHLAAILELKKDYNAPVLVETILGLPGDSYERTLESIDLFQKNNLEGFRPAIWNLLPETPAFSPDMRKKFNIQTKWFEIYSSPFRYKDDAQPDSSVQSIKNKNGLVAENVIGTYSYTPNEWCDMLALTMLAGISSTCGTNFLIQYLQKEHQIAASYFYDQLYKELAVKNKFSTAEFGNIAIELNRLVSDPSITKLDFDIGPNFPLLLAPHVYLTFLIMLHPTDFFNTVASHFSKLLNDNRCNDLGYFLANIMIDINYNPIDGRKFTSKFNWYGYLINNQPLTSGIYEYTILDKDLKFSGPSDFEESDYPSTSDYNEKLKQFFYHRASNQARKKYAQHIVERKIL